ncbi:MAG: hypothetical protein HYY15_02945 [Candidatus Omnitrophica bacterium]|nr:hypothetical protein [Candidatus Omnitrophota bacterium]
MTLPLSQEAADVIVIPDEDHFDHISSQEENHAVSDIASELPEVALEPFDAKTARRDAVRVDGVEQSLNGTLHRAPTVRRKVLVTSQEARPIDNLHAELGEISKVGFGVRRAGEATALPPFTPLQHAELLQKSRFLLGAQRSLGAQWQQVDDPSAQIRLKIHLLIQMPSAKQFPRQRDLVCPCFFDDDHSRLPVA